MMIELLLSPVAAWPSSIKPEVQNVKSKKKKGSSDNRTAYQEVQIVIPKEIFIFPAQTAEPAPQYKMTDYTNT